MNVQISPLETPPVADDEMDDTPGGHARTYLIGGVALAMVLGGFWYFTHDERAQAQARAGGAGQGRTRGNP